MRHEHTVDRDAKRVSNIGPCEVRQLKAVAGLGEPLVDPVQSLSHVATAVNFAHRTLEVGLHHSVRNANETSGARIPKEVAVHRLEAADIAFLERLYHAFQGGFP